MRHVHWKGFWLAMLVGILVNYLGDWVIGVRIELFWGLDTFNFLWFLQLFIWPVVVGIAVSFVYGLGGKWICLLPPLVVRWAAYYETQYIIGVPEGAELMPLGWWGFFVILAMETAMIGGVIGEIVNKRIYGRSRSLTSSNNAPADEADKTNIAVESSQTTASKDPS